MYLSTQQLLALRRAQAIRAVPPSWPARPRVPPSGNDSNPLFSLLAIGFGIWAVGKLLDGRTPRERIPDDLKDEVSRRAGWLCEYCGVAVTRSTRHIDHSVSLANGGTHSMRNLRNACAPCNLAKGAANGRDFRRWMD